MKDHDEGVECPFKKGDRVACPPTGKRYLVRAVRRRYIYEWVERRGKRKRVKRQVGFEIVVRREGRRVVLTQHQLKVFGFRRIPCATTTT